MICGYALVVSVDRYLEGQDVPDVAGNLEGDSTREKLEKFLNHGV